VKVGKLKQEADGNSEMSSGRKENNNKLLITGKINYDKR